MNAGTHPMNALATATQLQVLMQAIENAQKMVNKGITTVRDCGAKEFESAPQGSRGKRARFPAREYWLLRPSKLRVDISPAAWSTGR